MTRSKQTLHNQKTNETHCRFSSHAPATWIWFLVFLWSKKGWGENSTFSLKSGVWQCTKVPTEKGKKKAPKVFFKEICYSSCWLSSPEQWLQNHSSVPTPCPMSSASVFSLKRQKGFKSMGPYELNFPFFFVQNRIQIVGPDEFNCTVFYEPKGFFPFWLLKLKEKLYCTKKSDQLLW